MKSSQWVSLGLTIYSDLFELIADEHDIAHVSCFTVNPCDCCKYPANIAKITFKGQDLGSACTGGTFCKAKLYISLSGPPVSAKTTGD